MPKLTSLVALAFLVCDANATSAQAAVVTVGSPLTATFTVQSINVFATFANTTLPEAGANTVSPITGTVIRWRLLDADGGPFKLRVLRPAGGSTFTGVATSAGETPANHGLQTFTTSLPVQAGDLIGLDNAHVTGDHIGTAPVAGAEFSYWSPPLADGASLARTGGQAVEMSFNAEVQPPPVVSALGSSSGPAAGGTSVLIAGTDLENTTSVTFGGIPAAFGQVTESSLVATTPPSAAGPVLVTVKTLAGSSTATQSFSYQNAPAASPPASPAPVPTPVPNPTPGKTCTVPKLAGKSLKVSKTKIKGADCKVGKVTKKKGAKAATGKVVGQSEKPGTVVPAGTVVKVTLGKG
jgi:hypothetical protein